MGNHSKSFGRVISKAVIVLMVQLFLIELLCVDCFAILPRSQAQIQAFRTDPNQSTPPTDIGNVLDFHTAGATATQDLFPLNGAFHSSATTQVGGSGDSLKLLTSLTMSSASDMTPRDGLSNATYYSLSAAAEFRDILNITSTETNGEATVLLSFKLSGGSALSAIADHAGASAVMGGEIQIRLSDVAQVSETGSTLTSVGVFDGAEHTYDVSFSVELDENVIVVKQLDLLLSLNGVVSTFYAANLTANSGYTLELVDASVIYKGETVSDAKIYGDSGYVYDGGRSALAGHYTAKNKANHISFQADVENSEGGGEDVGSAEYKLNVDGAKASGTANITGVGPVTFGENLAKSVMIKKKNKPTRIFTMSVKKKGEDFHLVGKIKQKGKTGAIQFTAKQK